MTVCHRPTYVDYTYRYQPGRAPALYRPSRDPAHVNNGDPEWLCVARTLIEGNLKVVRYIKDCGQAARGEPLKYGSQIIELSDSDICLEPVDDHGYPVQLPLTVILGCVDARAPAEIIFGMEFVNDIFNVRLAGNVVAEECIGSIQYALRHLVFDDHHDSAGEVKRPVEPSREKRMRLVVSLGHEGCGAVTEAVRSFQTCEKNRPVATGAVAALLGHIVFPALIVSAEAFDEVNGKNSSKVLDNLGMLCKLVSYVHCAWGARELMDRVAEEGVKTVAAVGVVYGVLDPRDMHVRAVPCFPGNAGLASSSFGAPPKDITELRALALRIAMAIKNPNDQETTAALLADQIVTATL